MRPLLVQIWLVIHWHTDTLFHWWYSRVFFHNPVLFKCFPVHIEDPSLKNASSKSWYSALTSNFKLQRTSMLVSEVTKQHPPFDGCIVTNVALMHAHLLASCLWPSFADLICSFQLQFSHAVPPLMTNKLYKHKAADILCHLDVSPKSSLNLWSILSLGTCASNLMEWREGGREK